MQFHGTNYHYCPFCVFLNCGLQLKLSNYTKVKVNSIQLTQCAFTLPFLTLPSTQNLKNRKKMLRLEQLDKWSDPLVDTDTVLIQQRQGKDWIQILFEQLRISCRKKVANNNKGQAFCKIYSRTYIKKPKFSIIVEKCNF